MTRAQLSQDLVDMKCLILISVIPFLLVICCFLFVRVVGGKELSPCHFKAIYNFGDSNSDTGGIAAAFYPMAAPCGETFFHRPSGRGSDGRLIIDFIAEHIGLPYLGAYLDSIGTNFSHGANFATGGATIRPPTGSWSATGVSPFSLDIQTEQFIQFKARTRYLYDQDMNRSELPKPDEFSEALYVLDIGQNDLSSGFSKMNDSELFGSIPDLVERLATSIQNLYAQEARTFRIHNTGPVGCLPVTLHYHFTPDHLDEQGCVKAQNDAALEFNRQLKDRVLKLRTELPNATLTYVDMYAAKYELIGKAKQLGFVDAAEICCGYHEKDIHVWCGSKKKINGTDVFAGSCADPSVYVSWDGVHYTEAANHWIASQILNGSLSDPPSPITYSCLS